MHLCSTLTPDLAEPHFVFRHWPAYWVLPRLKIPNMKFVMKVSSVFKHRVCISTHLWKGQPYKTARELSVRLVNRPTPTAPVFVTPLVIQDEHVHNHESKRCGDDPCRRTIANLALCALFGPLQMLLQHP